MIRRSGTGTTGPVHRQSACPGVAAAGYFRGFQLTDDPFDVLVAILSNADFTVECDRPRRWAAAFSDAATKRGSVPSRGLVDWEPAGAGTQGL